MESNPIQSIGFHPSCLWNQLCRDSSCSDPCQLSVRLGLQHCVYISIYADSDKVSFPFQYSIRRIYFSDRLYTEEELPAEFKLFLPTAAPAAIAADAQKKQEETDTDWKEKSITVKKTEKPVAEGKEREEKIEEKENSAENSAVAVDLAASSQEKNETELAA